VGYMIHRFEVSDADAPPNSEPFSWDLRDAEKSRGSPSLPFTITEAGTLNVAGKLNSQRKNLYRLQVGLGLLLSESRDAVLLAENFGN